VTNKYQLRQLTDIRFLTLLKPSIHSSSQTSVLPSTSIVI